MIEFTCPKCDHSMSSPDSSVGQYAQCPECGLPIPVPDKDSLETQEAKRPEIHDSRVMPVGKTKPVAKKKPSTPAAKPPPVPKKKAPSKKAAKPPPVPEKKAPSKKAAKPPPVPPKEAPVVKKKKKKKPAKPPAAPDKDRPRTKKREEPPAKPKTKPRKQPKKESHTKPARKHKDREVLVARPAASATARTKITRPMRGQDEPEGVSKQRMAILICAGLGAIATFLPWLSHPDEGSRLILGITYQCWITFGLFVVTLVTGCIGGFSYGCTGATRFIGSITALAAGGLGVYWIIMAPQGSSAFLGFPFEDHSPSLGLFLVVGAGVMAAALAFILPAPKKDKYDPKARLAQRRSERDKLRSTDKSTDRRPEKSRSRDRLVAKPAKKTKKDRAGARRPEKKKSRPADQMGAPRSEKKKSSDQLGAPAPKRKKKSKSGSLKKRR
jgi:hypothetical protein